MIRTGSDSQGLVLASPTIIVSDLEYIAWEWARPAPRRLKSR